MVDICHVINTDNFFGLIVEALADYNQSEECCKLRVNSESEDCYFLVAGCRIKSFQAYAVNHEETTSNEMSSWKLYDCLQSRRLIIIFMKTDIWCDEHVLKGFLYVVENNGCDDWFTVYMNMILYDMILIDTTGCIGEGFFV